jgi:fructose-1,6-bisphosphatase I/sedoheptulose-1,7-bisphosphatase
VADYLQSGRRQVAAGYAIYGPATMLVITVGKGTHGFTLDREIGNFILTHPNLEIPGRHERICHQHQQRPFWEPPVHRYVTECQAGKTGDRGRDFNMRWIASMVAEVHRILMRGGVFMYPKDTEGPEQARPPAPAVRSQSNQPAGRTGRRAAAHRKQAPARCDAAALHQRVPLILGSRNEVERIERYHAEHASGLDRPYSSPLFNERSMFRPEARY